ncbi:MAG: energy-coupling factor ABC transporter permease [Deferrisomatales bacterium]|nr:energy-coupling factor ABC transporter permease [Deferrisomatales bacterium]
MHMADALLSPAVGGSLWAATGMVTVYCSRKVREEMDDRRVPLMGVLGAFIFAAQMINFTIPGTGSSGHLGGGMILAALLGPYAAFLVMASVLTVQALFFADGGLLALGANIFNLGALPCFVAYPLLFRPLAGRDPSPARLAAASVAAAAVGLQLGAAGVVLQTVLSGISELPLRSFLLLMLPIHLAIGVVEGLITAAVVGFVRRAQPELLARPEVPRPAAAVPLRRVILGLATAAAVTGVALSWFASAHPDGLEWAISRITGSEELERGGGAVHEGLERLQERTSFLPDYGFRTPAQAEGEDPEPAWPAVDPGTSVSGLVGGLLTLGMAVGIGWVLRRRAGGLPQG